MLIFNISKALNRVKNKRTIIEKMSPLEIPSLLDSGLWQSLILTGYSSSLT